MRPRQLEEVTGQAHLVGKNGTLTRLVRAQTPLSCIFSGPPGTGKTTLANLLAQAFGAELVVLSAVDAGVKELRETIAEAQRRQAHHRVRTALFVDELHRFHRGQQDALLPHVERGTVIFFGATTENPSFAVNRALLSRCRCFALRPLEAGEVAGLLRVALSDGARGLGALKLGADDAVLAAIARRAEGDARRALGLLELAAQLARARGEDAIAQAVLDEAADVQLLHHDRAGEGHYDLASALIKSLRYGDGEAAVYYLARALEGGESISFVARRLVIFASEDVGNACPQALSIAVHAAAASERVGMPEASLPLTQAALFLAAAPKSRAAVDAYAHARTLVARHGNLPPPKHVLNPSTADRRAGGYGVRPAAGRVDCLPEALASARS